jgi:hypothetical protein
MTSLSICDFQGIGKKPVESTTCVTIGHCKRMNAGCLREPCELNERVEAVQQRKCGLFGPEGVPILRSTPSSAEAADIIVTISGYYCKHRAKKVQSEHVPST